VRTRTSARGGRNGTDAMERAADEQSTTAPVAEPTLQNAPRARRTPRGQAKLTRMLLPVVTAVVFVGIWALIARLAFAHRAYLLPSPLATWKAAVNDRQRLWEGTRTTLIESAAGLGIALAIGTLAGVIMAQSRLLARALYPYAVVLQTVPIIAIAPVIVLWFHYGHSSVIAIATIVALFPILSNTYLGLISTDRGQIDLLRVHRAGRLFEFRELRVPAALPNLFAGLRISAGLAVVGTIVGEFLIGQGGPHAGLGVQIVVSEAQLDTALLFAEALMASLVGLVFFLAATVLSYRCLHNWHESVLSEE
jgi:NitT/TauT family transport system permease protein